MPEEKPAKKKEDIDYNAYKVEKRIKAAKGPS